MTDLLIITLVPSPILSQIPHTLFDIIYSVWMQFYVMTRTHVRQFTIVHVAKCHSTISWIMSSYFPMTGFKATVRASTRDNRHNCAPNRWGCSTPNTTTLHLSDMSNINVSKLLILCLHLSVRLLTWLLTYMVWK